MRKRRILAVLSLSITILTLSAQQLFIGTYNIRNNHNNDAREGNGWNERVGRICGQINFEQPDIFGTQEGHIDQLQDMLALLPGYAYIGVAREDGKKKGEHSAIFYRTDRLTLKHQGNFWLSETPKEPSLGWDAACRRICTWGEFKDRKSGKRFFYFNLHMDHVGVVARREAAKLVVQRIREIAGNKPAVLTGDFNVDQANEIYAIFTGSGLLFDSYEIARQRFAENGTFNVFNPDLFTPSRIDHVFVTKQFAVEHYAVMTNSYWSSEALDDEQLKSTTAPAEISFERHARRLPSDHYPVWAKVKMQ